MRKIILSIRGFSNLNSSEEKEVFWSKFINLQKNLPSNIDIKFILQTSNEKESELFSFLFDPVLKLECNEDNLIKNYYPKFDFKEYGKYLPINRNTINNINYSLKESYYISSLCSYFVNKKSQIKFDQLILLNYKIIPFRERLNIFIYDNLLPLDKIYLSYKGDIDSGYGNDLIIIPFKFLETFSSFTDFFLNSILNENEFLNTYNFYRDSFSIVVIGFKKYLFNLIRDFKRFFVNYTNFIENRFLKFNYLKLLKFTLNKLRIFVNIPNLTAENSYLNRSKEPILNLPNILPIKPILKYFIYKKYLRNETRFISNNDFENYNDSYLIGKKNFILVLKDDKTRNEIIIKSQLCKLKLKPKFIIFIKKNKITIYRYIKKSVIFYIEFFIPNKSDIYKNLLLALSKIRINNNLYYDYPILILESLTSFKSCQDITYLSTLFQFFIWENISYISLLDLKYKYKYKPLSSSFPFLYSHFQFQKPKLEKCIISFRFLKELNYSWNLKLSGKNRDSILVLNYQKKLFL